MAAGTGGTSGVTVQNNAIKASGSIVQVTKDEFVRIVRRAPTPVVVHTQGKYFSKKHKYMTSYKGFVFYTKTDDSLFFGVEHELVEAEKIWVPEV